MLKSKKRPFIPKFNDERDLWLAMATSTYPDTVFVVFDAYYFAMHV